ncbi:MAG: D-glycero-alpha-D-manno-heptose-1,7-bisphosphate 7-phosphatase [Rhizobiaceae bacterium]
MRPALFLDRDGVINVDHGYVGRIEDFSFIVGIFELVRNARRLGFVPVVVTNQSGIARGFYTEADFESLTAWMLQRFEAEGAAIERVYYCPNLEQAPLAQYRRADPRRKPGPGMLLDAIAELGLDASRSAMIGDKWSDALAARAAGVPRVALVGADPGAPPENAPQAIRVADLAAAAEWLAALTRQK